MLSDVALPVESTRKAYNAIFLFRFVWPLDPAAGQTTSQQPPPFTLPRTLGQTPPSTSALPNFPSEHPQMLDRSQPAPAAVRQASAPGLGQDQPGDRELPQPSASAKNVVVPPHGLRPASPPPPPPVGPSAEALAAPFSAEVTAQAQDPDAEVQFAAGEEGAEPEESMNTLLLPQLGGCSPTQAMEQEIIEPQVAQDAAAHPGDPIQPDPVEMEFPVESRDAVSSEGDQPEGERLSRSDSVPSLAAALMELHELLESNNPAHATCCSSAQPFKQGTSQVAPDPHTPGPHVPRARSPAVTPGAQAGEAKAKTSAAASEGPSSCAAPGLSRSEGGDGAEDLGERTPPPGCPESSVETTTRERNEVEKTCVIRAAPGTVSVLVGEAEVKGPADVRQGDPGPQAELPGLGPAAVAGEAPDARISSSPALPEVPQLSPPDPAASAQRPFIDLFPAEHIRRIQAAGFSASEAAEALQRAHGVVELALLTLLARSITVPT